MWHYNEPDPAAEDGTRKHPFLPVRFRLIGSQNSVAAYLNMLETVFDLIEVSDPEPGQHEQIRVDGFMLRRHPLKGGDH